MTRTGFLHHPSFLGHDAGPDNPERATRLIAIRERLVVSGLRDELGWMEARAARDEELLRVHSASHVEGIAAACAAGGGQLDWDTAVSEASWPAARHAAGAVIEAAEEVLHGRWRNAFCAVRPPGHHAERARAMGFCLFNNVAVAAAALRAVHGIERVAILDWDVHHGNGTQHIFELDPTVFYASLHQWPHYPGTGAADERGLGEGEGCTLNIPLAAGTGDAEWWRSLEDEVLPAFAAFRPQFLLLSAGFDAHRLDPLSNTMLSTEGYRQMTRVLRAFAEEVCDGRLVSVLEGGYDTGALAMCVEAHLEELVGEHR